MTSAKIASLLLVLIGVFALWGATSCRERAITFERSAEAGALPSSGAPGARRGAPEPKKVLSPAVPAAKRVRVQLPREHEAFTVAVISDLNASYGSRWYPESVHRAVDRLIELDPDLVLGTGDMVAGQSAGLDYGGMWEAFHTVVSDRLFDAGIAFAPTPGNHDASGYPQYENERAWYEWAWSYRMPEVDYVSAEALPFRYAFVARNVLFVSLDATVARPMQQEQREWLRDVLRAHADVSATIVYGHLPLQPFAEGRRWDTINDPSLEQLLVDEGVDLYLSGHHQAYYLGRHGGLRMLSTGCLGNGVRTLLGDTQPSFKTIVLLHIAPDGTIAVETLTGENFDLVVQNELLPPSVGEGLHRVVRDSEVAPPMLARQRDDDGGDWDRLEAEMTLRARMME